MFLPFILQFINDKYYLMFLKEHFINLPTTLWFLELIYQNDEHFGQREVQVQNWKETFICQNQENIITPAMEYCKWEFFRRPP